MQSYQEEGERIIELTLTQTDTRLKKLITLINYYMNYHFTNPRRTRERRKIIIAREPLNMVSFFATVGLVFHSLNAILTYVMGWGGRPIAFHGRQFVNRKKGRPLLKSPSKWGLHFEERKTSLLPETDRERPHPFH